eukprot:gnl/Hemi2/20987_TR6959_c0_g1_i1.p1 gnl/Hemi2/20987_TR6959_c0_g1~~gnl/Hemi2/20987_TR6959_c0_g1_i1.p1  ORF type:complete len:299 (+),score=94.32 gnl/Hemi2/20987_TR6959_c0_g1_i1:53-898(+)
MLTSAPVWSLVLILAVVCGGALGLTTTEQQAITPSASTTCPSGAQWPPAGSTTPGESPPGCDGSTTNPCGLLWHGEDQNSFHVLWSVVVTPNATLEATGLETIQYPNWLPICPAVIGGSNRCSSSGGVMKKFLNPPFVASGTGSPCPNNCAGHGSCNTTAGICNCFAPFSWVLKPDCSVADCPGACSGHGSCDSTSGVCNCMYPFAGLDCSLASCPNLCSGHGVCNTSTGDCACVPPFDVTRAPDCSVAGCPMDCSNHGVCDPTTGNCDCVPPFNPPCTLR